MIILYAAIAFSAFSTVGGENRCDPFWDNEISMLAERIKGDNCSIEVNATIPDRVIHAFRCGDIDSKDCVRLARSQSVKDKEFVDIQICKGGCRSKRSPLCKSIGALAIREGDNSATEMEVTFKVIGEIVSGGGSRHGLESVDSERLFWTLYNPFETYADPLIEGARNVLTAELLWATVENPPKGEKAIRKMYEVSFYNLYLNPHSRLARKMYVFAAALYRPPKCIVNELVKILELDDETAEDTSELLLKPTKALDRLSTIGSDKDLVCLTCWLVEANEQLWAELKNIHDRWDRMRISGDILRETQLSDAQMIRESMKDLVDE